MKEMKMKKLKNIKFMSLTLVVVVITTMACKDDFLEVRPTGSLTEFELTSGAGLEGSLIASYSYLLGRSGFYSDASNWFWGSVLGGDANKGTNAGDQSQVNEIQTYSSQTNNGSILQKYQVLYEGIARANATIRLAGSAQEGVSQTLIDRVIAEARFLRGHYYFELKKIFDDTPYIDETWDGTPVGNSQDLWQFIQADFQHAFDNLPETQGDAGRANRWAAGAYLGKTLLFQGQYDQAENILDQVIAGGQTANGQAYALLANYADNFRSTFDNNAESVFSVQAAAGTGTINNANPAQVLNFPHGSTGPARPGGCCGFFQPSFDLVNSHRTDANGLPLLDNSYNAAANAVANDMGLQSADAFTPDAGNLDTRLDHSVGRRGIPYLDWGPHPGFDWIRDQPYAGPFSPKKYSYYQGGIGTENDGSSWTPGYTAVNYDIIRFADVLLMAAEAKIEKGSPDLAGAVALIDQVRTRAAGSPVLEADGVTPSANYNVGTYGTFTDQAQARAALRFERKIELAMEGHRMYDLVRWGIAEATLNAYLAHEDPLLSSPFAGATFSAGQDEYLPIPQNEIDLLGVDVLIQNPGYN